MLRLVFVVLSLVAAITTRAWASTTVEVVGRIRSSNVTGGPWAGARVGERVHMTWQVVDDGFIYDPARPNQARRFDFVPNTFVMTARGIPLNMVLRSPFDPTTDLGNDYPVADVYIIRAAGDNVALVAPGTTTQVYRLTFELHNSTGTAWNSADMAQNIGLYPPTPFDYYEWSVVNANGTGFSVQLDGLIIRNPNDATGACCLGDGWCAVTSTSGCLSGEWSTGVGCVAVECTPTGACCLPTGGCELRTRTACEATPFAVYNGDNTACTNGVCPSIGACCIGTACSVLTQGACVGGGGSWMGADTNCEIQPQHYVTLNRTLPDAVFSTGAPGVYANTITIPNAGTVTSVEAWVDLQISRVNDLKVRLTGPNGTILDLWSRIGATPPTCTTTPIGPGYSMNGRYVFEDDASPSFYARVLSQPTGTFVAGGRFRASSCGGTLITLDAPSPAGFGGIPLAGAWTLEVRDERSGIAGFLYGWGLSFNGGNLPPCAIDCVADLDDGTGSGTRDGGVTIDDLLYYLQIFELGAIDADVDDGTGTGTRDGGVTIDDLLYFLIRFEGGC